MESRPEIIIVDDHAIFREGIKLLIEHEQIGEVVAEAENGRIFLDLLDQFKPDLVLMDIEMPVMNGLEATIRAKAARPGLKILVLTMVDNKERYTELINAGVNGFVMKTCGKQELEKAIKTVLGGEYYFSSEQLRQIIISYGKQPPVSTRSAGNDIRFTEREMEVLECFCSGMTASEIADKLCRSVKTVEAHRSKLLEKTNTKNTINLVLFAFKHKLVDPAS
ncbi:MAG: response regulator transcription factor [Bacteroidota bacterium]